MEGLIDDMPPTTNLVMTDGDIRGDNPLLKRLRSRAKVQSFPLLREKEELPRWIKERIAELRARITPGAISLLVEWVGRDQQVLTTELEKLSVHAAGEPITERDVRDLVPQVREASIFAAVDALVEGRLSTGVRLVRRLRADGAGFAYINAMLARQLRMVVLAKEMLEARAKPQEIGERLGIRRDFLVQRVVRQAQRSSWPRLKALYRGLLDADLAIKRGQLDEELALDLLLTRFSQQSGGRVQS
jgi:DNA polymerase-3 subunit delta